MSLINAEKSADTAAPQDNILKQAESRVETQLDPKVKPDYDRIVTAGMRIALAKGPNGILASLKSSRNPLNDCATGAVALAVAVFKESRGTAPLKALIPAMYTLMFQGLDFAQRAGLLQVDAQALSQATHIATNVLFKQLGITPQMLQTAAQKVHGMVHDPVALEKIKRAAGVTKSPNASEPTTVPMGGE
jgi:hypothetical protein